MQEDKETRLALDHLRQTRAKIRNDNRLSSWLLRSFVLHRLRQTERILEQALDPPDDVAIYTIPFSQKFGQPSRIVTADAAPTPSLIERLTEQAKQEDVSGYKALKALTAQGQAALQSGDTVTASRLASELLARNTDRSSWNYGNVIHEANQILGLSALQEGHTKAARDYLLAAGQTPGSPQLDTFGPTMTLAQALLRQGERDAVLAYLDEVARFWASRRTSGRSPADLVLGTVVSTRNAKSIKARKNAIRRGEFPILNGIIAG